MNDRIINYLFVTLGLLIAALPPYHIMSVLIAIVSFTLLLLLIRRDNMKGGK